MRILINIIFFNNINIFQGVSFLGMSSVPCPYESFKGSSELDLDKTDSVEIKQVVKLQK